MKTFAERFVEALETRRMTCAEVAKRTDIYEATLSNYKKGKYSPKQDNLELIAKALDVSIPWLMGADVPIGRYEVPPMPKNAIDVTGFIPVVGRITAGAPILAEENIVSHIPTTLHNPEEYFGLLVIGDSMINAGIPDGAYAILKKQNCAENGQIVACLVNGEEATLKTYREQGDSVILMPENTAYNPILVSKKDFTTGRAQILGVLREVTIKFSSK